MDINIMHCASVRSTISAYVCAQLYKATIRSVI